MPIARSSVPAASANIISSPVSLDVNVTNIARVLQKVLHTGCQIAHASCSMATSGRTDLTTHISAIPFEMGNDELERFALEECVKRQKPRVISTS